MDSNRTPVVHDLKCESEFFDALISRKKRFEFRKNDRNFMLGDTLRLTRTTHGAYGMGPPHIANFRVAYILRNFPGIQPDYCVMSVEPIEARQ